MLRFVPRLDIFKGERMSINPAAQPVQPGGAVANPFYTVRSLCDEGNNARALQLCYTILFNIEKRILNRGPEHGHVLDEPRTIARSYIHQIVEANPDLSDLSQRLVLAVTAQLSRLAENLMVAQAVASMNQDVEQLHADHMDHTG
ncbi:hypothetical protein COB21_02030 [Candidatus Aerophobetes bacterium]|uniref:Uncharacterized protein n=1 Tax=Aerophobetes bacterium TaxID=2030807 RepID=A0A2A4X6N1_UNCAE|nr:MAG: hypothetical protein COB21_02030 [Candidatus Aerophobetes bacterium]